MTRAERRTGGFTLVELMIAVGLSGIVIALVFQIHLSMVSGFNGQSSVSEVVDRATSARGMLVREVRMAGNGMPAAGLASADGTLWQAVEITNDVDGTGADMVIIRRLQGIAHTVTNNVGMLYVPGAASDEGFAAGEPIIVTDAKADAGCAAIPTSVDDKYVTIDWGVNPQCTAVSAASTLIVGRLEQIAFRLDPKNIADGVLQRLTSDPAKGGAWEPYGLGFSTLQFAVRMSESGDKDDADGDGDPTLDWYSGENQETGSGERPASGVPVQLGISVEARDLNATGGVVSTATMGLTDLSRPDNNPRGDWGSDCIDPTFNPCGVDLAHTTTGTDRPERYAGDHVYRTTSTRVSLRNLQETM